MTCMSTSVFEEASSFKTSKSDEAASRPYYLMIHPHSASSSAAPLWQTYFFNSLLCNIMKHHVMLPILVRQLHLLVSLNPALTYLNTG